MFIGNVQAYSVVWHYLTTEVHTQPMAIGRSERHHTNATYFARNGRVSDTATEYDDILDQSTTSG